MSFQLKIGLAKLALYWERLWRLSLPLLLSVSGVLSFSLFGLFERVLPVIHIGLLIVSGVFVLWSVKRLGKAKWPNKTEALRWLETSSGHLHRPASSLADTLSLDANDPATFTIWQAHQQRLIPIVDGLKPKPPKPRLMVKDPYSLRALALLVLVVAIIFAGPDWRERFESLASPGLKQTSPTASIDAWITPPRYTARAPVFLTSGILNSTEDTTRSARVKVPENSEFVARVSGLEAPSAQVTNFSNSDRETITHLFQAIDDNTMELRFKLSGSGLIDIREDGNSLLNWQVSIIPDTPPTVLVNGEIQTTGDQALVVNYKLNDDYGVIGGSVLFSRKVVDDGTIPPFARKSPGFTLTLPGSRIKSLNHSVFRDLTAHPWAGLPITLRLKVSDDAGQTTLSDPVNFVLPTRDFTKPLAQAIAEQREKLARQIENRHAVAQAIEALSLFPEEIIKNTVVYLGLRTVFYRLTRDHDAKLLASTYDLLWDLALRVEDGDLSLAERDLRAAQEALREALANNASSEEIDRLMKEMKKAMGRFLKAMNEKNRQLAEKNQLPRGDNNQKVDAQDLAKLLAAIENLAKSGANDAAQKMLSELQKMLESLQAGGPMNAPNKQQSMLSDMIQELSDMINQQQSLMDDTHKIDQNGTQPSDKSSNLNPDSQTLADKQQALRDLLDQMVQQFGQNGMESPSALDQAGKAMKKAEGKLREGNPGQAIGKQGAAIDQLRRGAQSMAQQMIDGLAQRQGLNRRGQNNGKGQTDPLGRPLPNSGPDFGLSTKIPAKGDIQRARELQRVLQKRIGEPNRPQLELDYLNRLLRRF